MFGLDLAALMALIPALIHVLTLVVTAAAAIAALTPSQADDTAVAQVLKVLDWLALNFGNAGVHNKTVVVDPAQVQKFKG